MDGLRAGRLDKEGQQRPPHYLPRTAPGLGHRPQLHSVKTWPRSTPSARLPSSFSSPRIQKKLGIYHLTLGGLQGTFRAATNERAIRPRPIKQRGDGC